MPSLFFLENRTNIFANARNKLQVQFTIRLRRRSHENHRNLGIVDSLSGVSGSVNESRFYAGLNQFFQIRLDDRRLAFVDQVDLVLVGIDAEEQDGQPWKNNR